MNEAGGGSSNLWRSVPSYAFRIEKSASSEAVFDILCDLSAEVGFDSACSRCFPNKAAPDSDIIFSRTSNFSRKLEESITLAPAYLDPFLFASVLTTQPFLGRELETILASKAPQREFYTQQLIGSAKGLIVPVFGPLFRNGYFYYHSAHDHTFTKDVVTFLQTISQIAYMKLWNLLYLPDDSVPSLSLREIEILNLVAKGNTTHEVANRLSISSNTVNTYINRVFDKFDVTDRTSAVTHAIAYGYIA